MRALYGALEQVLQTLRKSSYKTEEIPLTIIPEYSSSQVINESLQRMIREHSSEELFHVSIHYVSSVSRVSATCSGTMSGTKIVKWIVEELKPRKVSSFAIAVHPKGKAPRESNLYIFTTL